VLSKLVFISPPIVAVAISYLTSRDTRVT